MTAITGNFGLTKPDKEDFYDIEVQNENMEVIDQKLKELETGVDQVQDALESHRSDYVRQPGAGTTTGSANTYSLTLSPIPAVYVDGMGIVLKINTDSTAASTINVNGLGTRPLKKANGTDITNLKTNGVYTFRYNATSGNFILQGEGGAGNAVASDLLSGKTASTDAGDIIGTMPLPLSVSAGDNVIFSSALKSTTSTTSTKVVEFTAIANGTYRLKYTMGRSYSAMTGYAQSYVNGIAYGPLRIDNTGSGVAYTEDIPNLKVGDKVQVYAYTSTSLWGTYVSNSSLNCNTVFYTA